MAEAISGETPIDIGVYPKAQVLNRFIAKLIDLLIVAAADKLVPPVGFLAGVADGFAGGRSIGKRLIGLQTILPRTHEAAGFKESIVRNLPFGLAYLMFEIPYMGWVVSMAMLSVEGLLIIGNGHGRRLGDEIARTQVLDAGQLDLPD